MSYEEVRGNRAIFPQGKIFMKIIGKNAISEAASEMQNIKNEP